LEGKYWDSSREENRGRVISKKNRDGPGGKAGEGTRSEGKPSLFNIDKTEGLLTQRPYFLFEPKNDLRMKRSGRKGEKKKGAKK